VAKEQSARLFYLSRALDSLGMLTHAARHWLSPEACDALANELEPLVFSMAEKIDAHVPELVIPLTLDDDPRIDEVVETEMRALKQILSRLTHKPNLSEQVHP